MQHLKSFGGVSILLKFKREKDSDLFVDNLEEIVTDYDQDTREVRCHMEDSSLLNQIFCWTSPKELESIKKVLAIYC